METTTKIFDAVAESRKWREATSRKLDAMSLEERLDYLKAAGERYRAQNRDGCKTPSMRSKGSIAD
jgi:hypothetical protein